MRQHGSISHKVVGVLPLNPPNMEPGLKVRLTQNGPLSAQKVRGVSTNELVSKTKGR